MSWFIKNAANWFTAQIGFTWESLKATWGSGNAYWGDNRTNSSWYTKNDGGWN